MVKVFNTILFSQLDNTMYQQHQLCQWGVYKVCNFSGTSSFEFQKNLSLLCNDKWQVLRPYYLTPKFCITYNLHFIEKVDGGKHNEPTEHTAFNVSTSDSRNQNWTKHNVKKRELFRNYWKWCVGRGPTMYA